MVLGVRGSQYRKFTNKRLADRWIAERLGRKRAHPTDSVPSKIQRTESGAQGTTVIYTDGSALGNGQRGARAGFGVWFGHDDPRNVSEPLAGERQTNQRAEVMAGIRALEIVRDDASVRAVIIKTDSRYLVDSATSWMPGWRRANFKHVLNADLMQRLDQLMCAVQPRVLLCFEHVRAHVGEAGNEAADTLARAGARRRVVQ